MKKTTTLKFRGQNVIMWTRLSASSCAISTLVQNMWKNLHTKHLLDLFLIFLSSLGPVYKKSYQPDRKGAKKSCPLRVQRLHFKIWRLCHWNDPVSGMDFPRWQTESTQNLHSTTSQTRSLILAHRKPPAACPTSITPSPFQRLHNSICK